MTDDTWWWWGKEGSGVVDLVSDTWWQMILDDGEEGRGVAWWAKCAYGSAPPGAFIDRLIRLICVRLRDFQDKPATDIEFNQFKANSIAIALSISVSIFSIFDFQFRVPAQDFDLYHCKSRDNSIMPSNSVEISICITA